MKHLVLLAIAIVLGCGHKHESHDHGEEHPSGHDHHDEGHGHSGAGVSFTLWSNDFELFGEHSVAVASKPISFLVHVTALDGFRAVTEGSIEVVLTGPAEIRGTVAKPIRPGIYQLELTARTAGTYRGSVRVDGPDAGLIEDLEVQVFASAKEAAKSGGDEDDDGLIEFLKEQQWNVPFDTAFATEATLNDTTEVAGRVMTPPNGTAEVGAPVAGRIVAPRGGIAFPGAVVKKGQLLATISPTPSSPEAATRSALVVAEAEARAAAATRALERAERLIADEAIPLREVEAARREAKVAAAAVRAARQSAALYSGASGSRGRGTWRLLAPIGGVIDEVAASPGKSVGPGATLFRIVSSEKIWLSAQVPEQDAAKFRAELDASYRITGLDSWQPIDVSGDDSNASVVTMGRSVDPQSRTVEVIYSLKSPPTSLRVGGLVQLALPTGESVSGIAVPRAALVDRDGRRVVYVQLDGEHFAERAVRVRAHAGSLVAVTGVAAGERIVTKGAHLVRLAEGAGAEAHGHIH